MCCPQPTDPSWKSNKLIPFFIACCFGKFGFKINQNLLFYLLFITKSNQPTLFCVSLLEANTHTHNCPIVHCISAQVNKLLFLCLNLWPCHFAFIFASEDGKKEVGRFAKNFLPILFNMYTTGNPREDSSIFTVLETIKVYLKITDTEVKWPLGHKKVFVCSRPTDRVPWSRPYFYFIFIIYFL